MNNLELTIDRLPGLVQVCVTGQIVSIDAFNLKDALVELVNDDQNLILDLSKVEDISLTGLNALLMTKVKLQKTKSQLTLVAKKDSKLHDYLDLTKMTDQFHIISGYPQLFAA